MKKGIRLLSVLLLMLGMTQVFFPVPSRADESVRLICLNIGKADCMLLLCGEDAYLIDAGYEQTYPALEKMLAHYGVTALQGVFLTHCHTDHYGGLEQLAKSTIPVAHWYAAEICYDVKPEKHPLVRAAALRGQKAEFLKSGDTVTAGEGAVFSVLGPVETNTENENNNSLVMRFSSPQGSILLCGDMKEDEEITLLSRGLINDCDVLKVGHHGDGSAAKKALLRVVRSKIALILTDTREEKDTPASSTLSRLSQAGCKVYVSQDMSDGMEVTLRNGEAAVSDLTWQDTPARVQGLTLHIDMPNDLITLRNESESSLSLNSYTLYSSKGNDLMPLPDMILTPGDTFTVGSRATAVPCDLKWDKKRVWHEKELDMAILYDFAGRSVAWADNGLTE